MRVIPAVLLVLVLGGARGAEAACPVSLPTGLEGRRAPATMAWHGRPEMALLVPTDGLLRPMRNGTYRMKLFMASESYPGGALEWRPAVAVAARRLGDGLLASVSRPTNARAEDLGGWTMLVGLDLPAPGCWEVTATYRGHQVRAALEALP